MAHLSVTDRELVIRPTRFERVAGLLAPLTVPRDAITSARVAPVGIEAARGLRAPGLGVPGRTRIGTWRKPGHRSYVIARRGPALVLELRDQRYDTVVVDVADPDGVLRALQSAPA